MRRFALITLFVGAVMALALPALAVNFQVKIDTPGNGAVLQGSASVYATIQGSGTQEATAAAYHLRGQGGAWNDGQRVGLSGSAGGPFQGSIGSDNVPNGAYDLEVRAWGSGYNPGDRTTYANQVIDVLIDNAPPPPGGVQTSTNSSSFRVTWNAISTAGRSDFVGYDVYQKSGNCTQDLSAFTKVAQVQATSYSDAVPAGHYCFRVSSVRTSPVSGQIASGPSSPVLAKVGDTSSGGGGGGGGGGGSGSGGGGGGGSSGEPGGSFRYSIGGREAPPAPDAPYISGGGYSTIEAGTYEEDLPYGETTIFESTEVDDVPGSQASDSFGGDPRAMPISIAAGLVLAMSALMLRRFLSAEA